jgi:hypothetical protein
VIPLPLIPQAMGTPRVTRWLVTFAKHLTE